MLLLYFFFALLFGLSELCFSLLFALFFLFFSLCSFSQSWFTIQWRKTRLKCDCVGSDEKMYAKKHFIVFFSCCRYGFACISMYWHCHREKVSFLIHAKFSRAINSHSFSLFLAFKSCTLSVSVGIRKSPCNTVNERARKSVKRKSQSKQKRTKQRNIYNI